MVRLAHRSDYTTPVTLVLDDGVPSVAEPERNDDVRVSFRPSALDLMLFHRVTRAQVVLTGAVRLSGRRPWLIAPFLQKVRLP